MVSKSYVPSEVGKPVFVQRQDRPQVGFPTASCPDAVCGEVPFPSHSAFYFVQRTVISPLLRTWDGISVVVSTSATWGMPAGSLGSATHADIRASQALTKYKAQQSVHGQLKITKSSSTMSSARLPLQRFPWHGQKDDLFCRVHERDTYRERPSDSFPSANPGATSQL